MFNGYNDTPLISYNEFSQERLEKKAENVPSKWYESGSQPVQCQPNNRQLGEFWPPKTGFLGLPNPPVKCNCTGCYPSGESQSYQGDTARHRPWLPRSFPVPLNGSGTEPCKLPGYQWDGSGAPSQGSCFAESNLPYGHENGGKHPFYRQYQESNQPGVITSIKNAEYGKRQREDASFQNGVRQPATFCNSLYNLTKSADGRPYCDPNEKYSNMASFPVDQHTPRLPVVEPYAKAVPSNLSQTRVPSAGYRSVKENFPQSFLGQGYFDPRKACSEQEDKRQEPHPTRQSSVGAHLDYTHFAREQEEPEAQKLLFDNSRHSNYYSRNNFQDAMKRNNHTPDSRKDCAMSQMSQLSMADAHYNIMKTKYQEAANAKPSCEAFYSKDFEKTMMDSSCFQRRDDKHGTTSRVGVTFNEVGFADRTQSSLLYQSNVPGYRNYMRPEYPYQGYNPQPRYEYPVGFPRNDFGQYRPGQQQPQNCEQFLPGQGNSFFDSHCQQSPDKTLQFFAGGKSVVQTDPPINTKSSYLETIKSEEINKNGTSKISPLRLLRKKKFINVPQEPVPAPSSLDVAPGLDVRKFWSTWAEEEEENVAPAQMVVLDCQNIDPEQAKLFHLYEAPLDAGNIVLKSKEQANESINLETVNTCEQAAVQRDEKNLPKNVMQEPSREGERNLTTPREEEIQTALETKPSEEPENKLSPAEAISQKISSPSKTCKKVNSDKKKMEKMDKWTEKKFDFLKRAEESKAAEIRRHEEEKKKIFETRLSLQQYVKKTESPETNVSPNGDDKTSGSPSPGDSQSDDGDVDESDLPTCEYRRNKFLDYTERHVIMKDRNPAREEEETEKEEKPEVTEFSDIKPKIEPEIEDILKKMSEINVQSPEVEKKVRGLVKKGKKKKPERSPERDKLTVETMSKPTIKFSIQKSHDLKISFKVLNSSKKYSDEELGSEDVETEEAGTEESKNSTELITLKYKSIQRDGDNAKKSRRRFRRKTEGGDRRTPVLKIKKSRYQQQEEEKDPLRNDNEEESEAPSKPVSDGYSTSDDFQVQETVDSAKIKLTFKRHKGNYEKEYKVNGSTGEGGEGKAPNDLGPICGESDDFLKMMRSRSRKKSRRERKRGILAEAGIEPFRDDLNPSAIEAESGPDSPSSRQPPQLDSIGEEEPRIFEPTLNDSCTKEQNFNSAMIPAVADLSFSATKESTFEPSEYKEPIKTDEVDLNDDRVTSSECSTREAEGSKSNSEDPAPAEDKAGDSQEKETVQEISLDFFMSTNLPEIEINCKSGKTDETEVKEEKEINHSEAHQSSSESAFQNDGDDGKSLENPPERGEETMFLSMFSLENSCDKEKNERNESPLNMSADLQDVSQTEAKDTNPPSEPEKSDGGEIKNSFDDLPTLLEEEPEETERLLENIQPEKTENSPVLTKDELEEQMTSKSEELECESCKRKCSELAELAGNTSEIEVESQNLNEGKEVVGGTENPSVAPGSLMENNIEIKNTENERHADLSSLELEDGEIVDSSEELEESLSERKQNPDEPKTKTEFIERRIQKRHSASPEQRGQRADNRQFSKARSCPPGLDVPEGMSFGKESIIPFVFVLEDIPLPLGPSPDYSCFYLRKPDDSIAPKAKEFLQTSQNQSPLLSNVIENCREPQTDLGIFQRSSKIKFSISKRSRFSKLGLKNDKESKVKAFFPDEECDGKEVCLDLENQKGDRIPKDQLPIRQIEEMPKANDASKTIEEPELCSGTEDFGRLKDFDEPVKMLCEELEESAEVMKDFIREELYECEDIPTSEDLTNGDDMEIEKVNDDKFRNIMQNCLENAKKFLNVGNLKLFSCSVDDLLELDCQVPESALEDPETEKPANHISRDVLLTSCEDAADDLGLSENVNPADISMDFVPSFCTDVCPEILPVDNWPYLEEEVTSSPTKSKQDEIDLVPTPDANPPSNKHQACHQKSGRRRLIDENRMKRFRRRSLASNEETFKMCARIGRIPERRRTIDSFVGGEKDIRELKQELARLTNGKTNLAGQSLKCRLSLEKLTNKHGVRVEELSDEEEKKTRNGSLDYESPSWQPKVMLFRISKNELKKLRRSAKLRNKFESSGGVESWKMEGGFPQETPAVKKKKPEHENLYVKLERGRKETKPRLEKVMIGLSGFDSVKGSVSATTPTDLEARKRKKSRFRNLYTKKKSNSDENKCEISSAQKSPPSETAMETFLMEMFKDCDPSTESQIRSTKDVIWDEKNVEKKGSETKACSDDIHAESAKHGKRHEKTDGNRRKDGSESREGFRARDRHKQTDRRRDKHGRRGSGHSEESRRKRENRSRSRGGEEGVVAPKDGSPEGPWKCEVCGFDEKSERIAHIKNHPFHCQSCHLAFKTEAHFIDHLTKRHKNIRNQHHCLLCELSFDTEKEYLGHLETREHNHLESVEKNTINTLFTLLTGAPCPVLGLVELKPEWLPNQAGTVHFYHQATPLSLALQYLKMHRELLSFSSAHSK